MLFHISIIIIFIIHVLSTVHKCHFCLPYLKQLVVYTVVYNIKHGQMLCNNVYVPLLLRLSNDVEENPGPTIYEIIDPRETICADFSQGDIIFGQNAGKQCVAMSVTSIVVQQD